VKLTNLAILGLGALLLFSKKNNASAALSQATGELQAPTGTSYVPVGLLDVQAQTGQITVMEIPGITTPLVGGIGFSMTDNAPILSPPSEQPPIVSGSAGEALILGTSGALGNVTPVVNPTPPVGFVTADVTRIMDMVYPNWYNATYERAYWIDVSAEAARMRSSVTKEQALAFAELTKFQPFADWINSVY